jgi:hypothetical protein
MVTKTETSACVTNIISLELAFKKSAKEKEHV